MKRWGVSLLLCGALAAGLATGCANSASAESATSASSGYASSMSAAPSGAAGMPGGSGTAAVSAPTEPAGHSMIDTTSIFTERDLAQSADLSSAKELVVSNGQNLTISEEGVYVVKGTATNCTITVDADSSAKVQIVLDGVNVTNDNAPAIYVASADKVFVTTASGSTNELSVTGTFEAIGDVNVDGVIFSKDDLVLNGEGSLTINSSANGVVGKDDVKVTGGTYNITASNHGIQGKDSVAISNGTFTIKAGKDGIHSENSDDQSLGSVYISGGNFDITAESDGIQATTVAQIDGGTFAINAAEAIESTYVQVNNGTVKIQASDDGINATTKSSSYDVAIEINGGDISVSMVQGDTDALDSNGSIFITGGTVDITAQFAFDFDGTGSLTGGTVTVNGQQVTEITASMMGGGGGQGNMGQRGGMSGQAPSGDASAQGTRGSRGAMSGQAPSANASEGMSGTSQTQA